MHTPSRSPAPTVQGSSDRTFGLVFAAFFMVIGLLPWLQGGSVRLWALVASCVILIVAVLAATLLRPFNRLWTQFGLLLHRFVGPVALGILFFGVVTPTGLLMRLFGKAPLALGFDRSANSYWTKRASPGPTSESLRNQF